MMRFFPHDWSLCDDSQVERVLRTYHEFLDAQPRPVGPKVRSFLDTFSLNEALLDKLIIHQKSRLVEFRLVEGDNDRGYRLLTLNYLGAYTCEASSRSISTALLWRSAVIRYDEFDRRRAKKSDPTEKYIHRFLLWSRGLRSFAIAFDDFALSVSPLEMRRYETYGQPYETISE